MSCIQSFWARKNPYRTPYEMEREAAEDPGLFEPKTFWLLIAGAVGVGALLGLGDHSRPVAAPAPTPAPAPSPPANFGGQ